VKLILGPIASGKRTFVSSLGYTPAQMSADCDADAPVIYNVQKALRAQLERTPDKTAACEALLPKLLDRELVVAVEVGSGVIPLEYADRLFRETAGRLNILLAQQADEVIRMVWGIPQWLKRTVNVTIIRHAQTAGNLLHQYVGRTDEPLCEEGIARAVQVRDAGAFAFVGHPAQVYVSPQLRARQTAAILFGEAPQIVIDDLREMDFGDFEVRSAADMENDAAYGAWVASRCEERCPRGEVRFEFIARSVRGFKTAVEHAVRAGASECVIVAHGGTIMGVMDALAQSNKGFYDWHVHNCGAVSMRCDACTWSLSDIVVSDIEAL